MSTLLSAASSTHALAEGLKKPSAWGGHHKNKTGSRGNALESCVLLGTGNLRGATWQHPFEAPAMEVHATTIP